MFVLLQRLSRAPFGRVLRAIRDDEDVAAVAGKHVLAFKVRAFALGAAVLGVAGALYAHDTSYVAPDIFAPLLTLNVILALVAGGLGNNAGAVLGAALIVALLEGTRFAAPLLWFLDARAIRGDPRVADQRTAAGGVARATRRHPGGTAGRDGTLTLRTTAGMHDAQ